MKRFNKRLLALLLVVLQVISIMPTTGYAKETPIDSVQIVVNMPAGMSLQQKQYYIVVGTDSNNYQIIHLNDYTSSGSVTKNFAPALGQQPLVMLKSFDQEVSEEQIKNSIYDPIVGLRVNYENRYGGAITENGYTYSVALQDLSTEGQAKYAISFADGDKLPTAVIEFDPSASDTKIEAGKFYVVFEAKEGQNERFHVVELVTDGTESRYTIPAGTDFSGGTYQPSWAIDKIHIVKFREGATVVTGANKPILSDFYDALAINECLVSAQEYDPVTKEQVFKLTPVTLKATETPSSILGIAVEFGIVADTYDQTGHTETNFAVKHYSNHKKGGAANGFENIDIDGSGSNLIPFYVGEIKEGKLWISNKTNAPVEIIVNKAQKKTGYKTDGQPEDVKIIDTTGDAFGNGSRVTVTPEEPRIINGIVDSMISEGLKTSGTLSSDSNTTVKPKATRNGYIDLRDLPANGTIYVDCSDCMDLITNDGWNLYKLTGQTVVFNIPGNNVSLKQVKTYIFKPNGEKDYYKGYHEFDGSTDAMGDGDDGVASDKNLAVEECILKKITYNFYNATTVTTNNIAGLFLAPKATSFTQYNGAGWILAAGTVTSTTEWHFYYRDRHFSGHGETGLLIQKKLLKDDSNISISSTEKFKFNQQEWEYDTKENKWKTKGKAKSVEDVPDKTLKFPRIELNKKDFDIPDNEPGESKTISLYYVISEEIPKHVIEKNFTRVINGITYYIDAEKNIMYSTEEIRLRVEGHYEPPTDGGNKGTITFDLYRLKSGRDFDVLRTGVLTGDNSDFDKLTESNAAFNLGEFKNRASLIDVSANKAWLTGANNTNPPANATVTFELYKDGAATGNTITLDGTPDKNGEATSWTATWKDLPKYRLEGNKQQGFRLIEIDYKVKEVTGYSIYTADNTGLVNNGATITNMVGDLTINKTVIGGGNDAPASYKATVVNSEGKYVQEDGTIVESEDPIYVNVPKNGSITIEKLPFDTYTVTEYADGAKVTGYQLVVDGTKTATIDKDNLDVSVTLTNTYVKDTDIELEAIKEINNWGSATKFTFVLTAEKGTPMVEGASIDPDNENRYVKVDITPETEGLKAVFGKIKYTLSDLEGLDRKEFNYTIQEVEDGLVGNKKDGITYDTSIHNVVVTVVKNGDYTLTATATYDNEQSLTITNTYEATGNVSFKAKKDFTNGNLSEHNFQIRLTQVNGKDSTKQATENVVLSAPITKTVNADANTQTVIFNENSDEISRFIKNKTQDDTANEYWFLIEEVVPTLDENGNNGGVKYETAAQKWIKVTLTDDHDGGLTVTKTPAAGTDDLDVVFTNEQLGGVKVSKIFKDHAPTSEFMITAEYTLPGKTKTTLELKPAADGSNGAGTEASPYVWEITDLPIGTEVTFTESGITVDGYTVTTTFNTKAVTDQNVPSGKVTAAKDYPMGTFINTYERDKGALKFKKIVMVNGKTSIANYDLIDGDYNFHIAGSGLADGVERDITVTIENGQATDRTPKTDTMIDDDGYVVVSELPTGLYTITEQLKPEQKKDGIYLLDSRASVETEMELKVRTVTLEVTKNNTAGIQSAEFTNNKEIGELEISKTVTGTSDKTKVFTFEVTLTAPKDITLKGEYPAVETRWVAGELKTSDTTVKIKEGKVDPDVTLKADEKLVIKELPKGTGYTVKENDLPKSYTQVTPANNEAASGEIQNGENKAEFVNAYAASGTAILHAMKTADDNLQGKTFKFELYEKTGEDAEGNWTHGDKPVQTTEFVAAGQTADFPAFDYTMEDLKAKNTAGEEYYEGSVSYDYIIKEYIPDGVNGTKTLDGVTYDVTEYPVTITITDNGEGTLVDTYAGKNGAKYSTPEFTNKYYAEGKVQLHVLKELVRRELQDEEFSFSLYQVSYDPANGAEIRTPVETGVKVKKDGSIANFSEIRYTHGVNPANPTDPLNGMNIMDGATWNYDPDTKAPINRVKTITYVIVEDKPTAGATAADSTVIYSNKELYVTVTLTDDLNGTITAVSSPTDTASITFTNIVTPIIKVNAEKKQVKLGGAHFEVYDKAGTVVDQFDTSASTPHELRNLAINTVYRLHETEAPNGYLLWSQDCYIMILEDGTVLLSSSDAVDSEGHLDTSNVSNQIEYDSTNGVIVLLDTMKKVSATVKKIWKDDENRDGLRSVAISVTLKRMTVNGNREETVKDASGMPVTRVLSKENNWMDSVSNLPAVNDACVDYKYYWVEDNLPTGYTLDAKVNGSITTLTNSHTPDMTEVSVKKVWADNDDEAHVRPSSIYVQLFANGKAVGSPVTLEAANEWKHTWTELYLNENGTPIDYTVAETMVPDGYVCTIRGDASTGFVITNTYLSGKLQIEKEFDVEPWEPFLPDDSPRDIPVIKTWNDNNNKDGNRPGSVTVRLYADGVEVASAQLTADNNWRYTFTGLPRLTDEKEKINYTITEDPVEWYEAEIRGFNIRNNYKPELTSISVRKVWEDNANTLGYRPSSIAMKLNNGMTVILNEQNGWTATIDNLPTRVNGQPFTYQWTEQTVLNYTKTGEVTEGNLTTFTNTVVRPPKENKVNRNQRTVDVPEELDDYNTPLGVDVIINHVGDCFD